MPRPRTVLPDETVREIWRLRAEGRPRGEIAAALGISERQVRAAAGAPAASDRQAPAAAPCPIASAPTPEPAAVSRASHPIRRPSPVQQLLGESRGAGAASREGPRYPKRRSRPGPAVVVDGEDLGLSMLPQDVLTALALPFELSNADVVEVITLGAARMSEAGPKDPADVTMGVRHRDRARVAAASLRVTPSSVRAWRKRHRQMTWPELRLLLLGLKDFELGPRE